MDVEKPRELKRRKNRRGEREMVQGIPRIVILTDFCPPQRLALTGVQYVLMHWLKE